MKCFKNTSEIEKDITIKNSRYFLLLLLLTIFTGMMSNPKRYRILIPEKFSGTVQIYHSVAGADKLKLEDGYLLIIVPENGIFKTSSEPMPGKLHDEYWLYSGNKRERMSPYKLGGGGTIEQINSLGQHEVFYEFRVLKEERKH